ncbi:unnamed protein product [Rhizopus stolonifer]
MPIDLTLTTIDNIFMNDTEMLDKCNQTRSSIEKNLRSMDSSNDLFTGFVESTTLPKENQQQLMTPSVSLDEIVIDKELTKDNGSNNKKFNDKIEWTHNDFDNDIKLDNTDPEFDVFTEESKNNTHHSLENNASSSCSKYNQITERDSLFNTTTVDPTEIPMLGSSSNTRRKDKGKMRESDPPPLKRPPNKLDSARGGAISILTHIFRKTMEEAGEKEAEEDQPGRAAQLADMIDSAEMEHIEDDEAYVELYKSKMRPLLNNLKTNIELRNRVAMGEILPRDLVLMSTSDMANSELRKKWEIIRQEGLKNSILKFDDVPLIKKTHKGDIIMIPGKGVMEDLQEHTVTLLNQSHKVPTSLSSVQHVSTAESYRCVLRSLGLISSHKEKLAKSLNKKDKTPSTMDRKGKAPRVSWKGRVDYPKVAKFEISARQVGGRKLSNTEFTEVLPRVMFVDGKIESDVAIQHITELQKVNDKEIFLIQVEAQPKEDQESLDNMSNFLKTHQRYAVVRLNKPRIKDFYLIPLQKEEEIPSFVQKKGLEELKRDRNFFLGILVYRKKKKPNSRAKVQ